MNGLFEVIGCYGVNGRFGARGAIGVLTVGVVTERLITTGELARRLGVDRSAINRWHRSGWIAPAETTVGGHHRWRESEVRAQMAEQRQRGNE